VHGRTIVGQTDVPARRPARPIDPRRDLGRRGEDLAAEHLTDLGLVVLERNWRCREGELDIIATDGIGRVYFCEVKTRSGEGYGIPAESVTRGKRRKIRRLATLWLSTHLSDWRPTQFDVIAVLWPPGGEPRITYLPGAF
jgi:putative endonuclease